MLCLSLYRKILPIFKKESNIKACSCNQTDNKTDNKKESENITIEGMTCNHCVNYVAEAIKSVSGVESVQVSLQNKNAKITGIFSIDDVKKSVKDAGYSAGE